MVSDILDSVVATFISKELSIFLPTSESHPLTGLFYQISYLKELGIWFSEIPIYCSAVDKCDICRPWKYSIGMSCS